MGTISRAEMQSAIAAGGVVLHGGRVYHDPRDLPTDAELAGEDPARVEAAREALEARRKAIDVELAALDRPAPPKAAPAPASQPAAAPAASKVTEATPLPAARPEPPKVEGKK